MADYPDSVPPGKYWDGTFNIGPGQHLPESFSLPSLGLSLKCLKAINKI